MSGSSAAREGDVVCHGGVIACGASSVTINGVAAAIAGGSVATCALHGGAPVATGSGSVTIEGAPAARMGDVTGCGSVVSSGSGDVSIGG